MDRRSYNSIDLTKILMAVCVVAIHTHPLENVKNGLVVSIYSSFVDLAVPFFFIASGFLVADRFDEEFASEKNYNIVKKALFKFLKMYTVGTIAYLPITLYHFAMTGNPFKSCLLSFFQGFIFVGEQYNSWPLWYLLSSIYAFLLILFLIRRKCSEKALATVGGVIFGISLGISCIVSLNPEGHSFLHLIQAIIAHSIVNGRILRGAFYIPLGIILQKKRSLIWLSCLLFSFGFVLNVYIDSDTISSILTALTSIAFFEIIIEIKLPNSRIYPFVRKMSTVVYFTHMYIWTIYYTLIYGKETFGLDCFLVTAGVSLFIAFIYVYLKTRKHSVILCQGQT